MPKWKAEFEGKTFLEIIKDKVINAGIPDITCVIRKDSPPNIKSIRYAINPNPESGMFSSLFYGVNIFLQRQGYLIIPVDHPFFECETLVKLIAVFQAQMDAGVVRPRYRKRAGHPIIISASLAGQIPKGDYDGGLKKFIEDANCSIKNIDVDDHGILKNINRVEDL